MHVVEDGFEDRVREPRSQDVQRLDERHARLQQRRELLIKDEEFPAGNLAPLQQRGELDAGERAPVDYDTARTTDTTRYAAFFHAMLERGVALAPGPYEVSFVSGAHTLDLVDYTDSGIAIADA